MRKRYDLARRRQGRVGAFAHMLDSTTADYGLIIDATDFVRGDKEFRFHPERSDAASQLTILA